jgi:beta-mannanase
LDKPLFITEFGVKGPESFQDQWLANAAKTINANPHIFGVCYFNLYDNPKAWGSIKAPDWSMTPKSMAKFCSQLK